MEELLEMNGQTVDYETAKKFGLLDNPNLILSENLMTISQTKIKKNCICCGKEMELFIYEDRDFCDRCFSIVCREVFNKANDGTTVEEVREKIKRSIKE
jgi:hypothetical protein